uniref:RNA-directed RNA polymerase n=1 Tax=Steinernema glaseri TaxID=37863 RepID=A0A1I8AR02_9BILA
MHDAKECIDYVNKFVLVKIQEQEDINTKKAENCLWKQKQNPRSGIRLPQLFRYSFRNWSRSDPNSVYVHSKKSQRSERIRTIIGDSVFRVSSSFFIVSKVRSFSPTARSGAIMTARLRFVIESSLFKDHQFDEKKYFGNVVQNLQRGSCTLDLKNTAVFRPVTDDFGFQSSHLQIDAKSNDWEKDLPALAERFCNLTSRHVEEKGAPSILQISQDIFFKDLFEPIDADVQLESLSIGNLINPFTFLLHHRQNAYKHTKKNGDIVHSMKATFEHDNQVLKIPFDDKRGFSRTQVNLTVKYTQIRRIMVSVSPGDKRGDLRFVMFLQLWYPPEVRVFDDAVRSNTRCLTWRKDDEKLERIIAECPVLRLAFKENQNSALYNILSRLRKRTNVVIEFASILNEVPRRFSENPLDGAVNSINHSVLYLLEAILSRGAMVKDILLKSKVTWDSFVNFFLHRHEQKPVITIAALEKFLAFVTESRELRDLPTVCKILYERAKTENETKKRSDEVLISEGYQYIRKVIVTPSRMLLLAPELVMGNRGLRDFKEKDEDVIRVQFRDDDGDKLRLSRVGAKLIEDTVGSTTKKGLTVAGIRYEYFGNSGSQLRENGCYCFAESVIEKVRSKIGIFNEEISVPKRMSRIGQFFTQGQRLTKYVKPQQCRSCYDLVGGKDKSGNPYVFSDGVGMMSPNFAKKISEDLKLEGHIPSCFQFRFRGMKGVLAVNHLLTDSFNNDLFIRPSQVKFRAYRKKNLGAPLEIVKYSTPCGVALNRPLLNILDQVSEKQCLQSHERIVTRVHQLMDQQVNSLVMALTSETHCREKLSEMPIRMDMGFLSHEFGFQLTSEPFFRSLLQALCRCSIKRLRSKNNISIPLSLGRTVFGIIDESGQLQYGQVFCQVTSNGTLKHPKSTARKKVITGKVLMTKNPAIVGGDVRVFEAVDIPELRDLVDVVVFPRYGPRPHTDEMAGSDLDGDEYIIIWDEKLLLDHNEAPMHFPKSTKKAAIVPQEDILEKSCEFFVEYIKNDSVGVLAIAHLAVSDIYGLDSEAANNIAYKHALALDFAKTGDPPEPMKENERTSRYPDFLEKHGNQSCMTPGLNGQIYRRAKALDDILRKSMSRALDEPVVLDADLVYSGWEKYETVARQHFADYGAQIRSVMEKYGIEDEAQLCSGSIVEFRRRIGNVVEDSDHFGAFNVASNIKRFMSEIFISFRAAFFEQLKVTGENMKEYVCERPSEEMMKMSSAYYVVAYEAATEDHTERLLSFPWIAWDVLAAIKKTAFLKKPAEEQCDLSLCPFATRISRHVLGYCIVKQKELDDFTKIVARSNNVLEHMCYRYQGLNIVLFFLCMWAEENDVFLPDSPLQFDSFCLIIALFGMRKFQYPNPSFAWFDEDLSECNRVDLKNLHARFGGVGSLISDFLQFLSSREFAGLSMIDFRSVGYHRSCIDGKDLKLLHKTAAITYNEMVFSDSCDPLPQAFRRETIKTRQYEMDPFTIELPRPPSEREQDRWFDESQTEYLQKRITEKCGVSHLRLRQLRESQRHKKSKHVRILVSAIGSLDSLEKLKDLLTAELPTRSKGNLSWCNKHLALIILKKILHGTPEEEQEGLRSILGEQYEDHTT